MNALANILCFFGIHQPVWLGQYAEICGTKYRLGRCEHCAEGVIEILRI